MGEAERINLLIEQHEHKLLEEEADDFIRNSGWSKLLDIIEYDEYDRGRYYDPMIIPGKARDALLFLLGLEDVPGIDVDLKEGFRNLKGKTLKTIRKKARTLAITILREQIEKRNTFFLDTDRIDDSPFAILLPDILEARKQEIADLAPQCGIQTAVSTFYGFSVFSTGGRLTGADPSNVRSLAKAIQDIAKGFNIELEVTGKRLIIKSSFFKNCTKHTARILDCCISLIGYARGTQRGVAEILGRYKDSRALPFIHYKLSENPTGALRAKLLKALGSIGHPTSVDFIRSEVSQKPNESYLLVRELANIGGPESRNLALELLDNEHSKIKSNAAKVISDWNPDIAIDELETLLSQKRAAVRKNALLALFKSNADISGILQRNMSVISKVVPGMDRTTKILSRLLQYESIADSEEFVSIIVKCINQAAKRYVRVSKTGYLHGRRKDPGSTPVDILRIISTKEGLARHPKIVDAISKTISEGKEAAQIIASIRGYPQLLEAPRIQDIIIQHIEEAPAEYILFSLEEFSKVEAFRQSDRIKEAVLAREDTLVETIESSYSKIVSNYYKPEDETLMAIFALTKFPYLLEREKIRSAIMTFLRTPKYKDQTLWKFKKRLDMFLEHFPFVRSSAKWERFLMENIFVEAVYEMVLKDKAYANSDSTLMLILDQIRKGVLCPGTKAFYQITKRTRIVEMDGIIEAIASSIIKSDKPGDAYLSAQISYGKYRLDFRDSPELIEAIQSRAEDAAREASVTIGRYDIEVWERWLERIPSTRSSPMVHNALAHKIIGNRPYGVLGLLVKKYPEIIKSSIFRQIIIQFIVQNYDNRRKKSRIDEVLLSLKRYPECKDIIRVIDEQLEK